MLGKMASCTATASGKVFPGQYYDQETGLHYNYFRYYDPQTGRYITSDLAGIIGGLNTYAYVEANPTNLIDENGLRGVRPRPRARSRSRSVLDEYFPPIGRPWVPPRPLVQPTPGCPLRPRTDIALKRNLDFVREKEFVEEFFRRTLQNTPEIDAIPPLPKLPTSSKIFSPIEFVLEELQKQRDFEKCNICSTVGPVK